MAWTKGQLVSHQLLADERQRLGLEADALWRGIGSRWRAHLDRLGPASSVRAMVEEGAQPFVASLGYDGDIDISFDGSAACATALSSARDSGVAVVTVQWGEPLGPLWRVAVTEALRRGSLWAIGFNGTHVRLWQASRTYSRRYLEFDLAAAVDDEATAATIAWLLNPRATAASGTRNKSPLDQLVEDSDRQVVAVCRALRTGVLEASGHVTTALAAHRRTVPLDHAFEQALTIVYRLLFLFFAEARALMPTWHPLYRQSYSVDTLAAAALGRRRIGLWNALQATSRLAHAGCRAGSLRVTPFNGRLFAPARTPLAERTDLDDALAAQAIVALSSRASSDGDGRRTIAYGDLGVEQLGAVYETLLDYRPHRTRTANTSRVVLQPGADRRKATGTFYTPQAIADFMVRRALGPLVEGRRPEAILSLRVVDPAMGSGAFLVSACHFLSDAYEHALVTSGERAATDFDDTDRAAIRRKIAEHCLFGVDLNPMAVQLARLSLWLTTLAADRPLSFLDHRLVCGNTMVGTWLSRLRTAPSPGRHRQARSLPLFDLPDIDPVIRDALPVRLALAETPNDSPAHVAAKERALARLWSEQGTLARWKQLSDLWCAQWFTATPLPASAFNACRDALLKDVYALPRATTAPWLADAKTIAEAVRFFHWELEFPEIFFTASGERRQEAGFDAVIGNPPWEMMRDDGERERSSERVPGHAAQVLRFTRDAGVYQAQSRGHANCYQVFVERALDLARPGGSVALVLPWGAAADTGSASLRRMLFSRSAVSDLDGFDNRRGIFPIHRSVRFVLLSARAGEPTSEIRCRLGQYDLASLDAAARGGAHVTTLTPAILERLSGSDLAIPDLRSPIDLTLAERVAAHFQPLVSPSSWGARFGRELNATEDKAVLQTTGRGLPVVGGRHLEPFRVRLEACSESIGAGEARARLGGRHERIRLAYRDVSSPTNRLTLIAALLPARSVSTHTIFALRTALPVAAQYFLCGLFNSYVVNYLVRMRVTSHVTTTIVERLPVPTLDEAGTSFEMIAAAARRLSRENDAEEFAGLNARVARLYGLSTTEFDHVLSTFPLIAVDERARARQAFADRR